MPNRTRLSLILFLAACAAPEAKPTAEASWWAVVGPRIANDSRRIHPEAGGYAAYVGPLTARFAGEAVRLSHAGVAGPAITLRGWEGGAGYRAAPAVAPTLGGCAPGPQLAPSGECLPRLEYARGEVIEWWASTAAGFEQGFEVGTWPGEEVVLHVGSSSVAAASGAELRLGSGSASAWRVSGLRAWDADGAELVAAMAPEEGGFRIAVNLVGARFPVTIDPLYTAEDSLDGSEADAALGYAISAGGDVNGDGYPDAVVGAPWSDVSAADGGVIYSFLGTSSGLGTSGTAFTEALGADAQLGAALSIDGDVTGDGYDDLVWGAPNYASGNGATGLVLGGATGLASSSAGTLKPVIAIACGSAVRIVEDFSGDGYDDVLIGAPDYLSGTGVSFSFVGTASGWAFQSTYVGDSPGDDLASSVTSGDFDGDGQRDLVLGSPGGAYVRLQMGSRGLATGTEVTLSGPTGFGAALLAADLDGDGDDELVVGAVNDGAPDGQVDVFDGGSGFGSGMAAASSLTGSTDSRFGAALAATGDLDGDGSQELAVGAYGADDLSGSVSLYTYASGALTEETVIAGEEAGAEFGFALAGLGDADGDGDGELLVGAPLSEAGATGGGQVVVVAGAPLDVVGASHPTDTRTGERTDGKLGVSLANAGDLDDDGFDDLAVGAPWHDSAGVDAGAAWVYHGSATGLADTAASSLQGEAAGDRFGWALASAGDVNGDGTDALLVGAPRHDTGGADAGRVYLYEGAAAGISSVTTTLDGPDEDGQFGSSLAGGEQLYASGYDDVAVGSPYASPTDALGSAGRVHVYRGSAAGLGTTAAATLDGLASGDYFGYAVALVNVNRDHQVDLVVGANEAAGSGSEAGEVYVFQASDTGLPTTASTTLLGSTGSGGFGVALANAGDVDGDGYDDLLVGADGEGSRAGAIYLFAGSATGLSGSASWSATGAVANDQAGLGVAIADFDGDGLPEPVLASSGNDDAGSDAGAVTVYSLRDDFTEVATQTLSGSASDDAFGYAVGSGDFNGDGLADLAVGAPGADGEGSTSGAVSVYYGVSADRDGDGVLSTEDCDDGDATIGAASEVWYSDTDGDGYGDLTADTLACRAPFGAVDNGEDCNDGLTLVSPDATELCDDDDVDEDCSGAADDDDAGVTGQGTWYPDVDGDGYGDASAGALRCDQPEGYVADATDCDDGDASVYPDALEACGTTDHDCDGVAGDDDADVADASAWYADADGDGYGNSGSPTEACVQPTGTVADDTDCDDADAARNPAADETCTTAYDDDCDELVNGGDASVTDEVAIYKDHDGDGHGGEFETMACEPATGEVTNGDDCDDFDSAVNPAGTELCDADNVDEDCDGLADDADSGVTGTTWYADVDADGYGDAAASVTLCDQPLGYLAEATDCDDSDAAVNPGAEEACDAADRDEDCNGLADDDDTAPVGRVDVYGDDDGDGYGDAALVTAACDVPTGHSALSTDCDDADAAVHPGAAEGDCADPVDYNCDGSTGYADADADGAAACEDCDDTEPLAYPGGAETVGDGVDGDCDGVELCYVDADADTYRPDDAPISGSPDCSAPGEADSSSLTGDCDDADAAVNPAAVDSVGDPIDSDCDGVLLCWADPDGDGFHDGVAAVTSSDADCTDAGEAETSAGGDCNAADDRVFPGAPEEDCADPTDYNCDGSVGETDADEDGWPACDECDDGEPAVHPDAVEVCNGLDDDCDGQTDPADALGASTWAPDADGDGSTDNALALTACAPPEGYLPPSALPDCDDADPAAFPGAPEVPDDGVDQDCDGADLGEPDTGDTADTGAPADTASTGDTADTPDPSDTADSGAATPGDCGCAAGEDPAGWAGMMTLLVALAARRPQRHPIR